MANPADTGERPKRLLLATDLSARTDRALERALLLAAEWEAELDVLHVLEEDPSASDASEPLPSWRRPADPRGAVERQLQADLRDAAGRNAVVLVEEGEPGDVIVRTAERRRCDLIIVGLARNAFGGLFSLGGTVGQLLRQPGAPVLIVKDRARGPYGRIVVATDFSDSARRALETAAGIFQGHDLTLFHAYDAPVVGGAGNPASYLAEYGRFAAVECDDFLRSSGVPKGVVSKTMVEWGAPAHLLRDYAERDGFDLVVLGTGGRSAIVELIVGSVAKQILAEVPRDALVIRGVVSA